MVNALGKRPFDSADDMDKYLDEEVSICMKCESRLRVFTLSLFRLNEKLGMLALLRLSKIHLIFPHPL